MYKYEPSARALLTDLAGARARARIWRMAEGPLILTPTLLAVNLGGQ